MAKWQKYKAQETVLNMKQLAGLVSRGFTIAEEDEQKDQIRKGMTVRLDLDTQERLDAITASIPGMTKEKLVKFILDAGIFEYCQAYLEESLFPPDDEEQNSAESLINEALAQIKSGVK